MADGLDFKARALPVNFMGLKLLAIHHTTKCDASESSYVISAYPGS
jgi:hypothetical protein